MKRVSHAIVSAYSVVLILVRMSCKTEQKAQSLVYCGKLAVTATLVQTPADKQMLQPPGSYGRQW